MSEVLKTLNNIRSLRAAVRDLSLVQLEGIAEKLATVIDEKREAIKAEEAEKAKRLAGLNKYKELLEKDGISAEELVLLLGSSGETKKRESRAARPAKYKYVTEQGVEKTWTGQGRTPFAIQKALDAGKSLKDFEI
ncbi:H-NS family nucleoid-associated regulatory protein [Frederiksenia canicola]|uniref:DNA-binding protein n=1 Tax=Frederiksenia canicola TaxID=123824 RepID=A0AAE6X6D9_9PAST|nr:H-NS family nucleoid-associated regulatory protein [Frederiksenia canicola]QIM65127.1 DNA-binding protein H-NS-like protein [Frederiksenia canicola]RPE96452.1 DNA-binding protein H-NS [Frederiksenia canicola]